MSEFKEGDTVKLKSGGPDMCIEEINREGIYCRWWLDAEKKFDHGNFEPVTLEKVKPKEPPHAPTVLTQ